VDLIRTGKAPQVIRRKGAEGALPLPIEEKIEVLTLLAADSATDLREEALKTLRGIPTSEVLKVISNPRTPSGVLSFAAEHLAPEHEEIRKALLANSSLPGPDADRLRSREVAPVSAAETQLIEPPSSPHVEASPDSPRPQPAIESAAEVAPAAAPHVDDENTAAEMLAKLAAGARIEEVIGDTTDDLPDVIKEDSDPKKRDKETLIEKISRMSVVQKIKAAVSGNLETRMLLIRDSNKIISRAVLQSPKISDTEMESYAAAKNVSEEVLRLISGNRKFMKVYVVMRALANNPRAPLDVTLPLLGRLNERDLKGVSLNRNVPETLRTMATKAIKQKEEASKPKLPGKH
jgi:hypothetical protein